MWERSDDPRTRPPRQNEETHGVRDGRVPPIVLHPGRGHPNRTSPPRSERGCTAGVPDEPRPGPTTDSPDVPGKPDMNFPSDSEGSKVVRSQEGREPHTRTSARPHGNGTTRREVPTPTAWGSPSARPEGSTKAPVRTLTLDPDRTGGTQRDPDPHSWQSGPRGVSTRGESPHVPPPLTTGGTRYRENGTKRTTERLPSTGALPGKTSLPSTESEDRHPINPHQRRLVPPGASPANHPGPTVTRPTRWVGSVSNGRGRERRTERRG